MARLVTLALDASNLLSRYKAVHNRLFGFSIRKAFTSSGYSAKDLDLPDCHDQLIAIQTGLKNIASDVKHLDEAELKGKRGEQLHKCLNTYIEAMTETVDKLDFICRNLRREKEGQSEMRKYQGSQQFRKHAAAYDDSVQELRRVGTRLNDVLKGF